MTKKSTEPQKFQIFFNKYKEPKIKPKTTGPNERLFHKKQTAQRSKLMKHKLTEQENKQQQLNQTKKGKMTTSKKIINTYH